MTASVGDGQGQRWVVRRARGDGEHDKQSYRNVGESGKDGVLSLRNRSAEHISTGWTAGRSALQDRGDSLGYWYVEL